MKKDLFTDGISHIDVDAVERLLQIEQNMQAKKKRQRYARLLLIPAAALIALMVCMTAVIIPFIPKTLDVAYEPVKGLPENVWVYYVNDKGTQKRERVNLCGVEASQRRRQRGRDSELFHRKRRHAAYGCAEHAVGVRAAAARP